MKGEQQEIKLVKEKPGKTKKFLIKKKQPDVETKVLTVKEDSKDAGKGDENEFFETRTFSEISPEALPSMEMVSGGKMTDYVNDDGTYYYYTDGEAIKVFFFSFKFGFAALITGHRPHGLVVNETNFVIGGVNFKRESNQNNPLLLKTFLYEVTRPQYGYIITVKIVVNIGIMSQQTFEERISNTNIPWQFVNELYPRLHSYKSSPTSA